MEKLVLSVLLDTIPEHKGETRLKKKKKNPVTLCWICGTHFWAMRDIQER